MKPESAPESEDRELAARLAAFEEERARAGSADPREFASGLSPDAAARLTGALEGLARLQAEWSGIYRAEANMFPCPFGKFLLEQELGRGGHGIVFLAFDPTLNRRVALKIPRPELLDEPDWRRRFLREAHALARLDHPGVVAVLEVGEVDAVCYIASTYCDGPNLTAWLKARKPPLEPRVAAWIAALIAEAVGHAHAQGVVHRDLKPRNILMQPVQRSAVAEDREPRPRVTDFGLAKLVEAQAELTGIGIVLGTPRYMAPEQRAGRNDLVGPPTDVYAIGVILEEMLIGRRQASSGGSRGTSAADEAAREQERGGLPDRTDVPRALRAIVVRCLDPEPAHRYPNAAQLAADLNRFLTGESVHAARLSPRAILARVRASRVFTSAGLGTLVLVSLAFLFVFGQRRSERPGLPAAVAPEPSPAVARADGIEQRKRYAADMQLAAELAPSDLASATYRLPQARLLLDRYRSSGTEGDLRTWEWYHFEHVLHGERATVSAHSKAVYHLEYSPDGARVGTAGEDGARIWNAMTGAVELNLQGHTDVVNWIRFSPDGTRVATTSDDMTVRVWSAADGRRLLPPLVHQHKVVLVLFTPDGRRLVSCDRGAIITTWDSATGALIGSHKVAGEPLEGMDLSPDGSILAVAASHEVTLWDYPAMKRRPFGVPSEDLPARFDCVAFSHDGRRFATSGGASTRQVRIWVTQSGQLENSFTHHADERVLTVAFSPDDRLVLSTASDDAARIWDVARGECVAILAGHGAWVWSGGFSPDGRSVATGGGDGSIKLWDVPHRGAMSRFMLRPEGCLAMTYSVDSRTVYAVTQSGEVCAWDAATNQPLGALLFRSPTHAVDAVLAPSAELIVVADSGGTLFIGSPRQERPATTLPHTAAARPCLALSSNGKYLGFVATDGSLGRLALGEREFRPEGVGSLPSMPTSLAITNDGSLLAALADGRLFALAAKGRPAAEAPERGHQGRVNCLAVSRDGTLCATSDNNGSIVLWDRQTLRIRARLHSQEHEMDALAFTVDGQTLISSAGSVAVSFWNAMTGQPIFVFDESYSPRRAAHLAVAPDGSSIAAVVDGPGYAQGLIWHAIRRNASGREPNEKNASHVGSWPGTDLAIGADVP
jgi:eukaryotic-like serine/threonine-protein kinase